MPRPVVRVSGRRIRELCIERGITREQLAVKTHRATSTVGRWMSGETEPPMTVIGAIAEEIGVAVTDLVEPDPGVALAERTCAAQGIDVKVSDPELIERVSRLLGGAAA